MKRRRFRVGDDCLVPFTGTRGESCLIKASITAVVKGGYQVSTRYERSEEYFDRRAVRCVRKGAK